MTPFRALLAAVALCTGSSATALAVPGHAVDAAPVTLAPHNAAYDLSLESTHGGSTVAASGSMTFQITDACTSWASQQQLKLQLVTREGQSSELVSDYATLESKDGRHLTFDMQEHANGRLTQQVRGEASIDAKGDGAIRFTKPKTLTMALPHGTLFPMAHTAAIIEAAETGKRSIDPVLFDGTSPDGATDSYVTILGWHPAPTQSDHPELAGLGSGRIHVAFFARKPDAVSPDYAVGMRYFANGVSDRLDMDFGDFSMAGTLKSFSLGKKASRC